MSASIFGIDPWHPRMLPGQEPYTQDELDLLYVAVHGAAGDDPTEYGEVCHFVSADQLHGYRNPASDPDPADPTECRRCGRNPYRSPGGCLCGA